MVTKVITRPRCDSSIGIVKNGCAPNGRQKYTSVTPALVKAGKPLLRTATARSAAEEILRVYQERSGLWGLRAVSETSN